MFHLHSAEVGRYEPESISFLLTVPISSPPPESTASVNAALSDTAEAAAKPVGTIRWTPRIAKWSRLVVDQEYRRHGFARKLIDAVHDHVAEGSDVNPDTVQESNGRKVIKLKLHAQVSFLRWSC